MSYIGALGMLRISFEGTLSIVERGLE